jgi:hypothetical protein
VPTSVLESLVRTNTFSTRLSEWVVSFARQIYVQVGGEAERVAYCLHSLGETLWETPCPLPAVRRDERYLGHFGFLGLVCAWR